MEAKFDWCKLKMSNYWLLVDFSVCIYGVTRLAWKPLLDLCLFDSLGLVCSTCFGREFSMFWFSSLGRCLPSFADKECFTRIPTKRRW